MSSLHLVAFVPLLLALVADISCLSQGAPETSCPFLSPSPSQMAHMVGPQSADTLLYMLGGFDQAFASEDGRFGYVPGRTYNFNVTAIDGRTTFRGVLLQGRSLVDDSPLGTFTDIDELTRESSCDDPDSAITHSSPVDKLSVDLQWTAPPAGSGSLRIGWAIVQELQVYWGNLSSPALMELSSDVATTTATDSALGSMIAAGSVVLSAVLGLVVSIVAVL